MVVLIHMNQFGPDVIATLHQTQGDRVSQNISLCSTSSIKKENQRDIWINKKATSLKKYMKAPLHLHLIVTFIMKYDKSE